MDIVDAQIHLGREGHEPLLAQMHALGIEAALLSELWDKTDNKRLQPGYDVADEVWRRVNPLAERAAILHPERFSFLVQINRQDPDLESLIALIRSTPGARALRVMPIGEPEAFAAGAYDELFALAEAAKIPIFVMAAGMTVPLARYLLNFPRLTFIVDHCGVPWYGGDKRSFADVLALAAYPNVALKWAHAQDQFSVHDYPYEELFPYLRCAIARFGAERVMWASDFTSITGHSWADMLMYLRDSRHLSISEKEWILAGTARRILDWPKP